jgi:hypothetical protein
MRLLRCERSRPLTGQRDWGRVGLRTDARSAPSAALSANVGVSRRAAIADNGQMLTQELDRNRSTPYADLASS